MYVVDRFEGNWAVIEGPGKIIFNLPRALLPSDAMEGDVLNIAVVKDGKATKERKAESDDLLDNFFDEM